MRYLLHRLRSWWWNQIKPEFDEPDYDDVSAAAFRQWVASHKHPAGCAGGCQCKPRGSD